MDLRHVYRPEYKTLPTEEQDGSSLGNLGAHEGVPWADATDNPHLAAARAMAHLMKREAMDYLSLEKHSVYGAAIAMPQVARSVGWPITLTGLAIRSYIFLAFNLFIQFFLLSVINEELRIMYARAGRMHLCDFGADVDNCPEGANCWGPGGTQYTPTRVYDFGSWATRNFVKSSLTALFPKMKQEIAENVDAGEYGLEDYYCRLACCLIFILAIVDDLTKTLGLLCLLLQVPTAAECWISYEVPTWDSKDRAMSIHGWQELDLVKFRVCGMPMKWKVINVVFVFMPKCAIWWTLTSSGFHFLMETAGIVDLVVNCMALAFVLSLDEMCFERLATQATKHIMLQLEDIQFEVPEDNETDEVLLSRFRHLELGLSDRRWWRAFMLILPKRMIFIAILMFAFLGKYYINNCIRQKDGSWVSRPMRLPDDVSYNPFTFMYDFLLSWKTETFWEMPEDSE